MKTEEELRAEIVAEAKSWIGTPYHHEARIKGAGVDCGTLILEVYEKLGLIPHFVPEHYPADFMLHRNHELYLKVVLKFGYEIFEDPLPGDIVVFKNGRIFSHGGVVTRWPQFIHSSAPEKRVGYGNAAQWPFTKREYKKYRFNGFKGAE